MPHGWGMIREERTFRVRELELLRHAPRDPASDGLSAEGRSIAEELGRRRAAQGVRWERVFVSPATRAAETAAWILRGAGSQLPEHSEVPGLAGEAGSSPEAMAEGVRALIGQIPDGSRALAISHTPLVERAVHGLTGREPMPMAPCEGALIQVNDEGATRVEELRLEEL